MNFSLHILSRRSRIARAISGRVTLLSFAVCGCAALMLPGCGSILTTASGSPGGNTAVTVLATSTANDEFSEFPIQITSIALIGQSGNAVTLLSSSPGIMPEFIHLNGPAEPIATVSVPQGVYTSAAVTIPEADFACAYFSPPNRNVTELFGKEAPSGTTVNLPAPITVTGTSMAISLNLLVSESTSLSACTSWNISLPPPKFTPVFEVSAVATLASGSGKIKATVMHGLVTSIDVSRNSFSMAGANEGLPGNEWQIDTYSGTVFQGIGGFSQLASGLPVDLDLAIQPDGSLLATRVAVCDTDTTDLSVFYGPVEYMDDTTSQVFFLAQEQYGYLLDQAHYYSTGSSEVPFGNAKFQISGALSNLDSLPFAATFTLSNIVPGQTVLWTTHDPNVTDKWPATTVTLMPQTIDGTVSAIGSEGGFTTYAVTLAPYDLFPALAVQPGQAKLLTNPNTVVVYADGNTQMLNTSPVAVGDVVRFYGLVFNDNGTLRMDCAQINDGVAE